MKLLFVTLCAAAFAQLSAAGGCTEEAVLCSDGTAVGRDPDNNCAFKACPPAAKKQQERKADTKDGGYSFRDVHV